MSKGSSMFQTIVVGTDGSETATSAVQKAVELAALCGGTLHLVHAHKLVSTGQMAHAAVAGAPTFDVEGVNRGIEEESRQIGAHAASQAERAGVQCETHLVPGDAADSLIDVATTVGADLIVVGNRGMTGARRFFLGSVPNKVAHHCPCNLLIIDTTPK
jgi:nucleotide-binding universal stress UspA family protein